MYKYVRGKYAKAFLTGYFPSISVGCAAHRVFTRTDKMSFRVNSSISDRALQKRWRPEALQMEAADST